LKLVECVPNFSEGRDLNIINSITKEIELVEGVMLLDVDPGADTNRTVVTFIGPPEQVKIAAFNAIKKAAELIDMSKHKGAHPRMGATDVCPFVPVSEVSMDDCVKLAKEVGKRVAEELNIPVYLYEEAASKPERANLADVRKGEYEGLPEKLLDPEWQPDFGEAVFNPHSGALITGAREFLIAYNVNLNTRDKKLANEIALNIKEAGRAKKDENGKTVKDEQGNTVKVPGTLKYTKAIGWYIEEYGQAQVSINLTNYKVTPPHIAFEEVRKEADKLGLVVTGSELVGLIPKDAMLMAGRYYLEKQGKCPGVPDDELIIMAIKSMGLDQLSPFDPEKKIIEYRVSQNQKSLIKMPLNKFVDELSTSSPAPGGGSVSALCGALSAALSSMVANLTVGKKGYEEHWDEMKKLAIDCQNLKDRFLEGVNKDTEAFNRVMDAMGLPKKTEDDKKEREKAIEEATKKATLIPLNVLRYSLKALELSKKATVGNVNSVSDAGVAALTAYAAAEGAHYNIKINLKSIKDKDFKDKKEKEANQILTKIKDMTKEVRKMVLEKLSE